MRRSEDVDREDGQQRQGHRPDGVGHAEDQADQRAPLPGRLAVPQQQRGGQHDQELERDVAQDQVLELDLEPVEQDRQGGQRGDPARRAEPVPGQRVDHDRDGQAHKVLQDRYHGVTVQWLQELQEDRVTGRPGRVRVQVDHVAHVGERVVEPDLPLVAELGVDAQQQAPGQGQRKELVVHDPGAHRGTGEPRPEAASPAVVGHVLATAGRAGPAEQHGPPRTRGRSCQPGPSL